MEPEEGAHPRERSRTQASLCLRPQEEKQLEGTQVGGGGGASLGSQNEEMKASELF